MGFSVSGSFAILVLASFIAFGMVYTAGANGFERVTDATTERYDDDLARQNTAIEIVQIESRGTNLYVNVTNRGTTTLGVNDTDLLLDNEFQTRDDIDKTRVIGSPNTWLWLPGETLYFRIKVGGAANLPERVKVVSEYGVADAAEGPG